MSKKKKVIAKTGNKKPVKKPLKKATKPSPKKNAAKKPSKPANAKKAKPVVKKKSVKVAKPAKKSLVKASKPKAAVKVISKNKPKKVVVKKSVAVKKAAVKKVISKKAPVKPVAKPAKSSKPVKAVAPKKSELKKAAPKPEKVMVQKPVPVPLPKKETAAQIEKVKKAEEIISKKQLAEKKSNEVLAITNTIPVKEKNEISLSKIASISHSITNPIKKTDSYAVKPEKEPNGKFELEFVVHSSAEMLYEFLSTPSGLSEWFCDDLNIRNGIYTFIWDDQLQQARLLKTVDLQLVRFQWVDKTDGSYFEFRIQRDDLTNDISLIITDFAETAGDRESSKLLWHSQIEKLMHVIGSIF